MQTIPQHPLWQQHQLSALIETKGIQMEAVIFTSVLSVLLYIVFLSPRKKMAGMDLKQWGD